jgi:hypothetical protein
MSRSPPINLPRTSQKIGTHPTINYGLISLIPKTKEANTIKQFRPISLQGVDYKWFTKVLAGRLTKVAESMISKTQIAYP